MMTDKQIGDHWRECIRCATVKWQLRCKRCETDLQLMCKIIRERSESFYLQNKYGWDIDTCRRNAAASFNINLDEYMKARL